MEHHRDDIVIIPSVIFAHMHRILRCHLIYLYHLASILVNNYVVVAY